MKYLINSPPTEDPSDELALSIGICLALAVTFLADDKASANADPGPNRIGPMFPRLAMFPRLNVMEFVDVDCKTIHILDMLHFDLATQK